MYNRFVHLTTTRSGGPTRSIDLLLRRLAANLENEVRDRTADLNQALTEAEAAKAIADAAKKIMSNLRTASFYEEIRADNDDATAHVGRMQIAMLPAWPRNETDIYLCGPVEFMQTQWRALLQAGVPVARLHREVFGPEFLNYLS